MRFSDFIKDYLTFNKRERRGIFILLILLLSVILYLFTAPYFIRNGKTDFSETNRQIALFKSLDSNQQQKSEKRDYQFIPPKKFALLPFDPNTVSRDDWVNMGVREPVANTILSYRNKGGKFRKKEDLKKIYGLDARTYARIEPFIFIREEKPERNVLSASVYGKKSAPEIFELNLADSAELLKIRGIGPYYAGKIIRYRNRLGGFADTRQLLEVFNSRDSIYVLVKDYVNADLSLVKKISINTAPATELGTHPYIGWNKAKVIVRFREQHGKFSGTDDLEKIKIIHKNDIEKLKPYLEF